MNDETKMTDPTEALAYKIADEFGVSDEWARSFAAKLVREHRLVSLTPDTTGAVVVESTEVTAADVAMAFANLHQRIVQASQDIDPEVESVLRNNLWSLYDS